MERRTSSCAARSCRTAFWIRCASALALCAALPSCDSNVNEGGFLLTLTLRASLAAGGTQPNGDSMRPSLSADGRYIAFESLASNLVPGNTVYWRDIFVRDMEGGTVLVSLSTSGAQANGDCQNPAISGDGRHAAFESNANDLVWNDTNAATDIFVRDRVAGTTVRVSVDTAGTQADGASTYPSISADGRFVVFHSAATNLVANDTNGTLDIFLRDRDTDLDGIFDEPGSVSTTRLSVEDPSDPDGLPDGSNASGASYNAVISANGQFVAFSSDAPDLIVGDTNGTDVFVRDFSAGTTTRVSLTSLGAEAGSACLWPAISADGRYVAFESQATNLVPDDTNSFTDVFVRDTVAATTVRASVNSQGMEASGSFCFSASISADGRFVVFQSQAANLVSGDTNEANDVFLRDLQLGTTIRVSVSTYSGQTNLFGDSGEPSISADGRFVAFQSEASTLVENDSNGLFDVYRRGPLR